MLLLDTCTLLWLGADQTMLSKRAVNEIADNAGMLCVSAISAFEIAIKVKKKKLKLKKKPLEWYKLALDLHGITEIALTATILVTSISLPDHHLDPADRMIVATAKLHKMPVLTPDKLIKKYKQVDVIW